MPEESEDGFDVLDLDADTGEFDVEESEVGFNQNIGR